MAQIQFKRWLLALPLFFAALWWVTPRGIYYFAMTAHAHTPSRPSDYSTLAQVLPPTDARILHVFRGLPHQMSERGDFRRDLFLSFNRPIEGYYFYGGARTASAETLALLETLLKNPRLYRRYGGPKMCGGFHPDFCIEWQSGSGPFRQLVCLGCEEIVLTGPSGSLICDGRMPEFKELCAALRPYFE